MQPMDPTCQALIFFFLFFSSHPFLFLFFSPFPSSSARAHAHLAAPTSPAGPALPPAAALSARRPHPRPPPAGRPRPRPRAGRRHVLCRLPVSRADLATPPARPHARTRTLAERARLQGGSGAPRRRRLARPDATATRRSFPRGHVRNAAMPFRLARPFPPRALVSEVTSPTVPGRRSSRHLRAGA